MGTSRKDRIIAKIFLVLSVLFSFSDKSEAQQLKLPASPIGEGWELVPEFSDEFNGKTLDADKWWDFNPGWYGRKPGYFERKNVIVKDGNLKLTARVQKPGKATYENVVRGYDKFTTSAVKTKERILYGYFEARCRSMKAGVCNAFWLYDPLNAGAKYTAGSLSDEIDIFEFFGKRGQKKEYNCDNVYFASVHRFATPYVESLVKNELTLPDKSFKNTLPFDISSDFHIYGLLWTPEAMKWYVDGKELFVRKNDFTAPLHIVFDCEIMPDWVGLPEPEDLPATFNIDYLRVWKLKTE